MLKKRINHWVTSVLFIFTLFKRIKRGIFLKLDNLNVKKYVFQKVTSVHRAFEFWGVIVKFGDCFLAKLWGWWNQGYRQENWVWSRNNDSQKIGRIYQFNWDCRKNSNLWSCSNIKTSGVKYFDSGSLWHF